MKKTAASRRTRRVLRERLVAELSSIRPEPLHLKMIHNNQKLTSDTYRSPLVQQQTWAP